MNVQLWVTRRIVINNHGWVDRGSVVTTSFPHGVTTRDMVPYRIWDKFAPRKLCHSTLNKFPNLLKVVLRPPRFERFPSSKRNKTVFPNKTPKEKKRGGEPTLKPREEGFS